MVSIIIGGVIGVTEEISIKQVLWHHISCNMVLVWHIAPQSVLPNQMPGGIASFLFLCTPAWFRLGFGRMEDRFNKMGYCRSLYS